MAVLSCRLVYSEKGDFCLEKVQRHRMSIIRLSSHGSWLSYSNNNKKTLLEKKSQREKTNNNNKTNGQRGLTRRCRSGRCISRRRLPLNGHQLGPHATSAKTSDPPRRRCRAPLPPPPARRRRRRFCACTVVRRVFRFRRSVTGVAKANRRRRTGRRPQVIRRHN